MMSSLIINRLSIKLRSGSDNLVSEISFAIKEGESLILLGQSGSGKTMTCSAVLNLLDPKKFEVSGSVFFGETDLLNSSEKQRRGIYGNQIVYIPQNPMTALDPSMRIGRQMDETVVLLSHKKADSYIHIDVEFGEGEGKIPVDSIAKRAEAYKPKEKVTYKMIKEYIEAKYGFKVHTAYIAEVKRNLGLPMYDAPNAVEELKQPRKHPTPEKVEAIKDALRYFAVI